MRVYVSEGDHSKSLVMVHGLGVSGRYWLPLAENLTDRYSVYIIDLPGFGKSQKSAKEFSVAGLADALISIMEQIKAPDPLVIGHSFGCQVALRAIKENPGVFKAAVLIGPTINIFERSYPVQIVRWLQNLRRDVNFKIVWTITKDIIDCGLMRFLQTVRLSVKDRPEHGLENVNIPILFLRGGYDPIAPPKWLAYLKSKNKLFATKELADTGHAVHFNAPKQTAEEVKNFYPK